MDRASSPPPSPLLPLDDVRALITRLDGLKPIAQKPQGSSPADGRVLRLQVGYNPNSSSLGISVVMLLWGMGIAGVILQAAAVHLLAAGPQLGDGSEVE